MLPFERELIDKLLKEKGLTHLKCNYLYQRSYKDVQAIINIFSNLSEEQKLIFMPLLTSNIWNSNSIEVQNIIDIFSNLSEEQKNIFMPTLSSTIWNSNSIEVQNIIDIFSNLSEEQKNIFMPTLSSTIWISNSKNINQIINSKIWKNKLYTHLLSKSIWTKNITKIEKIIELMEELGLENYITISCLSFSPLQIKALYNYLIMNNYDVIIDNKLNPIFNVSPTTLLKRYGINLKELVKQEKEKEHELSL